MKISSYAWRWSLAAMVILTIAGLFIMGIQRLRFDADILNALPQNDPVLADARHVITHHPIYDRIVVDVSSSGGDAALLLEGADLVEAGMRRSGLFREVGFQGIARVMPELMGHITNHLPLLFNARDLERDVKPLLEPERIRRTLAEHMASLGDLGGIGQTAFIAADPLALRNHVLSRISSLAPAKGARIQNGKLVSADGKHVLIMADPAKPGMDTRDAERIASLMAGLSEELHRRYGKTGGLSLTPVGAYRAALDNETSAKRNVKKAVLFSTAAIALLLLIGFPRPLIGLLSLLPAFAGTMAAFFVYSLLHPSISLLAVGFGGAIISFTVDYGIAYLLFLDRPYETRGMEATREVWSLGFLAMLTTAISFASLSLSGFPALAEIGQFAALGVVFTYVFVHAVFPLIFPVMPPARRPPSVPMQRFVNRITSGRSMWKVYAALVFGIFMLLFAKPDFRIDLNAMNAVSEETLHAERRIREVWGDIFSKVYLMVEGKDRQDFQQKSDGLAAWLDGESARGGVSQFFLPSQLFPGETLAKRNASNWKTFWNAERIAGMKKVMGEAAVPMGFAPWAFDPFFRMAARGDWSGVAVPEQFAGLLGIRANPDGSSWRQVVALTPGPAYRGEDFYKRLTATGLARVFDPVLFTERFGALLLSAFIRMAILVGLITILTAFFYFLDWRLTLIGLTPTLFALICTFGTLNLLGQPLGIPILMISVVIIGMGTDYALYFVRSYQRYLDEDDASLGLIRLSVFLSFATTFLGFGVLALSDNALLKSAGLGLALGIGYSFLGAVMIAPPLLKRVFADIPARDGDVSPGSGRHLRRAVARYRSLEAYPRLFARFKILLDPMFPRLAHFVTNPRVIVDIGSGYGIPAVWLLELFPGARIFGLEPDRRRVRIAARAIGARGMITIGAAPALPDIPEKADTALVLDMIHLLSDESLALTLQRLRKAMGTDGLLVVRATVPSQLRFPWKRWIETSRVRIGGGRPQFRTEAQIAAALADAGFQLVLTESGPPGQEEHWFIARANREESIAPLPASEAPEK